MPFHGWGFGTNPLRHLALLDARSPEGGAFCVLSPAGHGTILNGLRCALAIFSGKSFYISRLSRSAERDRRFFHGWGRSRKLHLQRLLPTEARRCGRMPLPSAHGVRSHLPQGDGFERCRKAVPQRKRARPLRHRYAMPPLPKGEALAWRQSFRHNRKACGHAKSSPFRGSWRTQ